MNKIAVVIMGAVTSGKTTLARAICRSTGFTLVSEENRGDYHHILEEIRLQRYPNVVIEHCDIGNSVSEIARLFDRVYVIFLSVNEELLLNNYIERLRTKSRGDFTNIDPVQQQREMLEKVNEMKDHLLA